MKAKKLVAVIVALFMILTIAMTACKPQQNLTDEPLKGEIVADFTKGASESVFESDGWTNGSVFNVVWAKENVEYGEDAMHLGITEEERTVWVDDAEKTYSYTAGEARTALHYGYGDYEVSMKPAKKVGTASTFFTCTGPYDTGLDGEPQKHDEIDIEFLGKDTTKVQFNYFVNGKGGHEYMYNLGFDASKEYHTYGFRWTKDYIVWFVDGKPVYKVEASEKNVLPSAPGRMLMNYWCGTKDAEGWMGKYAGPDGESADYQWIKTNATGVDLSPSVDVPSEGFTGDWSTITESDIAFASSSDKYTVTKTDGITNITYADVKGNEYINVAAPITEAATEKNWLHLTITNNATTDVQVRINVIDDALANAEKNKSSNIAAYMDGEAVFTDLEWGGSFFNIAAGKTVEAEVNFGGTPDALELMIDSSRNDGNSRAGDISISNVKFAKQGDIAGVEPTPDVPVEHPTSGDLTLMVNDTEITFAGNVTDGYGVNANDQEATLNVKYDAITGASYKNIWAAVNSIARAHNVFGVKITNNGSESVTVRIDIESETNKGNTTACNLSATQDGQEVYTDLEWGGSTFTVAAGATVLAEVTYDTASMPTNIKLFFDSSVYDDTATHSGDITLSEIAFTGEVEDQPDQPGGDDTPSGIPTEGWTDIDYSSFGWYNGYTVDKTNGLTISHDTAVDGWKCEGMVISDYRWVKLTITNNGAGVAEVRIDIKRENPSMGAVEAVYCETDGVASLNTIDSAAMITLAAGQTVEVVLQISADVSVDQFVVFLNSMQVSGGVATGSITISKLQGIAD